MHDPQHASEMAPPATPPTLQEEKGGDRQQLIQVADLLALHARVDLELGRKAQETRERTASVNLYEQLHAWCIVRNVDNASVHGTRERKLERS